MLLEFPKLKDEKTDFTNNTDILLSELKSYDKIISENIYRLEIIEFEVVWKCYWMSQMEKVLSTRLLKEN